MKKFLLALALWLAPFGAMAQQGGGQQGTPALNRLSIVSKATIAGTNTFQLALALSQNRTGCTVQNNGTHTMFLYFDRTGTAVPGSGPLTDTTLSFQLGAGQSINCNVGGTVTAGDAIWLTGTAGDVAVVSTQ